MSAVVSNAGAGTIKVSPSGTVFDSETQITVTATKNFGYKFVNWTDANNKVVSTDEEYTFSSKVSTILPLADALVAPSAGMVLTSTGALPSLTSWAVPVSYTHLDVYKRQAELSAECDVLEWLPV